MENKEMKSIALALIVWILYLTSLTASASVGKSNENWSRQETQRLIGYQGFFLEAKLGLNPLNTMPTGGISGDLFINKNFGIFIGADISVRGRDKYLTKQVSNLDIPFGVVGAWTTKFFSSSQRFHVRGGGFYAVPLSSPEGEYFGIYTRADLYFSLSKNFGLGPSTWVKVGVGGKEFTTSAQRYIEGALGLSLMYY